MIELWFDFSCPYAYLAARRAHVLDENIDRSGFAGPRSAAEGRGGVSIDWRPMLLGGVFRGIGAGAGPMASLSPARARYNLVDMHRWAARWGVPFRMPAAHPMRTVRALRTLLGLPRPHWPAAIHALFAAYWEHAADLTADPVIAAALSGAGIPASEIATALAADTKEELHRRTDEAIALGIFGAPAWILRRPDHPPALIWGQDRFPFVRAALDGWDLDGGPPPAGAGPRSIGSCKAGAAVDVYFDVSSPFSYLALTQLPALAAAGVAVRLVPILLGALFRDLGTANVPLLAFPPPKQRYLGLDLDRWARWWGVPLHWPAKFPQRTVTAQRLVLIAEETAGPAGALAMALALGRAMWAEQVDLEDDASVRTVLARAGFAPALLDRTQEPAVKQALAANTARARDAGVFGVPTFAIGDELYWGQDRLELVVEALA
jgi:2-hydroxychromene-2-carboxylate isomerase